MAGVHISRCPIKRSFLLAHLNQSITQTRAISGSKRFKKLKEMQACMQCDDDLPVYLKKGTPDKILFGISTALLILGGFGAANFIWRSAQK